MSMIINRRDLDFILYETLGMDEILKSPQFADYDREAIDAILDLSADLRGCAGHIGTCHGNAICKDIPGSYLCACDDGFTGNGISCSGRKYRVAMWVYYFRIFLCLTSKVFYT